MSQTDVDEPPVAHQAEADPMGNSLNERMTKRATEAEKQTSEWFPIPGWEDLIEVELRALGYQLVRKIIAQHERIKDVGRRELYALCDQLLRATVSFREVRPDGTHKPLNDTWVSLASRIDGHPDFTGESAPRQALLFLVGEDRIAFLVSEWGDWVRSARAEIDEEVARDFTTTR